jgi:hypothetical protein
MPSLLVTEVPSSLPMPLVSDPPIFNPLLEPKGQELCLCNIWLCKHYLHGDGAIIIFHDVDLIVLKEIESFLENNGHVMKSIQGGWS